MRIVGMDIHRVAAEAVVLREGAFKKLGRISMLREALEEFARKELTHDDHVVIEATGNAAAVAELRAPHVNRVVIANPKQDWGRREGMKSVRECVAGIDVDLATLLWTHGRDYPLTRLEGRLKCPRCGSRRVVVMFQPPSNTGRRLRAAG